MIGGNYPKSADAREEKESTHLKPDATLSSITKIFQDAARKELESDKTGPIDFDVNLQPKQSERVIKNLNMTRGRKASALSNPAKYKVIRLIKKNNEETDIKQWQEIFTRSQVSMFHESKVIYSYASVENAVLTGKQVEVAAQSPWVSICLRYKDSLKDQTLEIGTMLQSVVIVKWPVGRFRIRGINDIDRKSENKDNHHKQIEIEAPLFEVNKDFSDRFDELLETFSIIKEDRVREKITRTQADERYSKLATEVKRFFDDFGEVLPLSVLIGLLAYRSVSLTVLETASLEEVERTIQNKFLIPVAGSEVGASASMTSEHTHREVKMEITQQSRWIAIGGSLPSSVEDPYSLSEHRNEPDSWRAMEFNDLISVTDLLPDKTQDKIKELDTDPDFFSVFHQFHEGHLFRKQYPPQPKEKNTDLQNAYWLKPSLPGDSNLVCMGYTEEPILQVREDEFCPQQERWTSLPLIDPDGRDPDDVVTFSEGSLASNTHFTKGRFRAELSRPAAKNVIVLRSPEAEHQLKCTHTFRKDIAVISSVDSIESAALTMIQQEPSKIQFNIDCEVPTTECTRGLHVIRKVTLPVMVHRINLEDVARESNASTDKTFKTNPEFVSDFKTIFESFENTKHDLSCLDMNRDEAETHFCKLSKKAMALVNDFGEVIPLSVEVGLAAHQVIRLTPYEATEYGKLKTEIETWAQTDEDGFFKAEDMKESMVLGISGIKGFNKLSESWATSPEDLDRDHISNSNPDEWRATRLQNLTSVLALLPWAIRSRVMMYVGRMDPDFFSVFHAYCYFLYHAEKHGQAPARYLHGWSYKLVLGEHTSFSPFSVFPLIRPIRLRFEEANVKNASQIYSDGALDSLGGNISSKKVLLLEDARGRIQIQGEDVDRVCPPHLHALEDGTVEVVITRTRMEKGNHDNTSQRNLVVHDVDCVRQIKKVETDRLFWVERCKRENLDQEAGAYVIRSVKTKRYLDAQMMRMPPVRQFGEEQFYIKCADGPLKGFYLGLCTKAILRGPLQGCSLSCRRRWVIVEKNPTNPVLWSFKRNWPMVNETAPLCENKCHIYVSGGKNGFLCLTPGGVFVRKDCCGDLQKDDIGKLRRHVEIRDQRDDMRCHSGNVWTIRRSRKFKGDNKFYILNDRECGNKGNMTRSQRTYGWAFKEDAQEAYFHALVAYPEEANDYVPPGERVRVCIHPFRDLFSEEGTCGTTWTFESTAGYTT